MRDLRRLLVQVDRNELEEHFRRSSRPMCVGDNVLVSRVLDEFLIYSSAREISGVRMAHDGYWEIWVTKVLAERVQPGWACADVGATWGYYALLLEMLTRSTQEESIVLAYEAHPDPVRHIRRTLEVNGLKDRITVFCDFVTERPGYTHVPDPSKFVPPIWIPNATLQGFDLDFVKVDVPGSTEDVIRMLLKHQPRAQVVVELNLTPDLLLTEAPDPPEPPPMFGMLDQYSIEVIGADSICRPVPAARELPMGNMHLWLTPHPKVSPCP